MFAEHRRGVGGREEFGDVCAGACDGEGVGWGRVERGVEGEHDAGGERVELGEGDVGDEGVAFAAGLAGAEVEDAEVEGGGFDHTGGGVAGEEADAGVGGVFEECDEGCAGEMFDEGEAADEAAGGSG